MLEIHNLNKFYNGPQGIIRAIEGITLSVKQGEFVAAQGPSGCGKTTLLLTAGGLLIPDNGQVIVDGQNPFLMSPDDRARFRASEIGFVFQQFCLIPYLNVIENVLTPSLALPNSKAEKRARELIEHLNLTDRIYHIPSELSTGERQRTALCRALLNNPKLLLADEPTGNLDKDNADIVLSLFVDFAQTGGSVLMVTHDDTIISYAHRIIHIRNGKLRKN